jgi:hypothetical protein
MHDARVARLTCFVQFEALNCLMICAQPRRSVMRTAAKICYAHSREDLLCAQPRRPVMRTAAKTCYAHSRKDLFYAYFRERFDLHLCFQLMLCGFDVSTHDARDVRWRSFDTLCMRLMRCSMHYCCSEHIHTLGQAGMGG